MPRQARIVSAAMTPVVLAIVAARGQPVLFVDEFNGTALSPGWTHPPAKQWAYNVSGGALNVTGLFFPNTPPAPNVASIASGLEPAFTGFDAIARMGMDQGVSREIRITLLSLFGPPIAAFGWADDAGVFAQTTGDPVAFGMPSPGLHEFMIRRRGNLYAFLLDGLVLTTLSGSEAIFGRLELRFTGPSTAPLGTMRVDRVVVFVSGPTACYVNCDGSTATPVLNVNDFTCFQSRFAAADPYANCDGSTIAPVLNVNDFVCFQQRFAVGCP